MTSTIISAVALMTARLRWPEVADAGLALVEGEVAGLERRVAYDGVQVQVGLAVLPGEVAGDGGELIVGVGVAVLDVLLRLRLENAEGDVAARADAAHGGEADVLLIGELNELLAELLPALKADDYLVSESAVLHVVPPFAN